LIRPFGLIVIGHRELGAEKEIPDGILMKHPVNKKALGVFLKINPVIVATKTVEDAPFPFDLLELLSAQGSKVFGKDLKFGE
jgi:hypothetical protein